MTTIQRRKNVTLAEDELDLVNRIRRDGSAERDAVRSMTGAELSANTSQSESIRLVVRAGVAAIEERVLTAGYAAMAAERDDDDRAYAAAARSRTIDRAGRD